MRCNKLFIIIVALACGKVFCAEIAALEAEVFSKKKPLISVKARLDALSQKAQKEDLQEWEKLNYELLRRTWKKGLIQLGMYKELDQLMNNQKFPLTEDIVKQ